MIASTRLVAIFDTIKYLRRGGRIGKAVLQFGSLLNIKPLLEVRDGVLAPIGAVRSVHLGPALGVHSGPGTLALTIRKNHTDKAGR